MEWSEEQFQRAVMDLARVSGWLVYHTHDSRRSQPGFPDLVLVHPKRGRLLFRELKATKGRVSPAQHEWLDALRAVGVDAAVWRPVHWVEGAVRRELVAGDARA